jgi:thiamine pyrophosphate-dependent acetolactate synthase large subunit-like protein
MARTIGEHRVGTLVEAGVRRIYGIVGDSLNPITDAIARELDDVTDTVMSNWRFLK